MTSTSTATASSNSSSSTGSASSTDSNSNNGSGVNSIEAEYNKIPDRNGWHRLYQEIREKCDREANEKHFSTLESEKSKNRCLNRYRDVNPYDHSRIILHRGSVDYVNANLVKLERADRKYILTQGPLCDTVGHFWLMVWEQNTKAILMLNKLVEKKQVKCHLYWPDRKGADHALKLNDVNLTVEFLRLEQYKNYCRRWFKLTDLQSNKSREIIQFHYTTWPDFGIPSSPVAFLQFLKSVRDSGALDQDVGPAVVHCSAGIGRSGTFCLVDCCLVLVEKEGENNVAVKDILYELRRYRMGLIQTADQLYFSYQAIIEGIKLLRDPDFLEYSETPIVCEDDEQRPEQFSLEETPPPLPPRTHSLLPLAGSTAGGLLTLNLRGEQMDDNNQQEQQLQQQDHKNKDALNNFINNERNAEIMSNRPLPPLPPQTEANSLNRVHESESDENECYEDDSDSYKDDDDNSDNDENANNESNGNTTASQSAHNNLTSESGGDAKSEKLLNGISPQDMNTTSTSPDNELKRRKRIERLANIEQKVNDIKRKQRETEDGKQSAKKRRSFVTYFAAGVIVVVVCVYAYTKLA